MPWMEGGRLLTTEPSPGMIQIYFGDGRARAPSLMTGNPY